MNCFHKEFVSMFLIQLTNSCIPRNKKNKCSYKTFRKPCKSFLLVFCFLFFSFLFFFSPWSGLVWTFVSEKLKRNTNLSAENPLFFRILNCRRWQQQLPPLHKKQCNGRNCTNLLDIFFHCFTKFLSNNVKYSNNV